MFEITGKVVYQALEGGFWAIAGDDGKNYCPVELPREFQREGCRVKAVVQRVSGASLRMWGIDVAIHRISAG